MRRLVVLALVASCSSPGAPITAHFDLDRASGFFSAPFPSDLALKPDGTIAAQGLPVAPHGLGAPLFQGYVRRLGTSVRGFGLNTAVYFQLSGPLDEVPLARMGARVPTAADPVLLLPAGGAAADLVPLDVHFHPATHGDPYLAENLLAILPRTPLRGGVRYVALLTDRLRARGGGAVLRDGRFDAFLASPAGADVEHARTALSLSPRAVVAAAVFTTQDVAGELDAIRRRAESAIEPAHLHVPLREVRRIEYVLGTTAAHARPAMLQRITFTDGGTDTTELEHDPAVPPALDLAAFPYRVFEARIRVPNLQGLAQKPYGSPGLGVLNDAARDDGQIRFVGGEVASVPEPEEVRVVVAVPLDAARRAVTSAPVLFWDHGTGHTAYQAVWPDHPDNRGAEYAALFARHRLVLVSRDQPLFGQRYRPAADLGYNSFLVAYNLANITAFRDTLRQSAADNAATLRFVREALNPALAAAGVSAAPVVDTARLFRFGHSLGSVTTHLAVASQLPGTYQASFVSGSGGIFSLFFLESGLLPRLAGDPANLGLLLQALDVDPAGPITPRELLGALAGIPRGPARAAIGRWHPAVTLAQTILDPADPISHAGRITLPVTLTRASGDLQVPNSATDALAAALAGEEVVPCTATRDYDPHQCVFREDAGVAAVRRWLERYVP